VLIYAKEVFWFGRRAKGVRMKETYSHAVAGLKCIKLKKLAATEEIA
jgi:hypothetical protein